MLQLTNKGFTLLEMNLYLLIVAMMGIFIIPNLSYMLDKIELKHEAKVLENHVRSLQLSQLASHEKQESRIAFKDNSYTKIQTSGKYNHESSCQYQTSFQKDELVVSKKGSLSGAGKVKITCGKTNKTVTFNIGYGYE